MAFWPALYSRRTALALSARPSLTMFFLLVGAFLLTVLPHVAQLPAWLSLAVIAVMVIRSILELYRLPLPSSTFCGIVAVCLLAAILLQFHTLAGRDPGTAFTIGLLAIKFYELRGPRDLALIIFACFFVVMSSLLYSQVLELFIYCLIMMWVLTALLLRIQTGDLPEDRLLLMLRRSGLVFLQALPLAVFLFFFFPRYSGKLGISLDESTTGLTDTVQPGAIAALSKNDSEAMYVRITPLSGGIPTPDSMYWRALVLWQYENGIWTPGDASMLPMSPKDAPHDAPGGNVLLQEITIRPHYRRWLFALDTPVTSILNPAEPNDWAMTLNGNVLQLGGGRDKLEHMARYTVTSSTLLNDEEEPNEQERKYSTKLPKIDPAVVALADQLYPNKPNSQDPLNTQAYIYAVLHFFRQGGFKYSATPGAEGPGDWLPNFLFKTRTGFCEHYASAFAVLMRLKQIPSRVVVGYQGAEYNPYADFYSVRQSNAHAWDEVWIPTRKHWVRVDPTSFLNPAGAVPALPGSETAESDTTDSGISQGIHVTAPSSSFAETYLPAWLNSSMHEMRLRREELEANWDDLVFSYDPEAQRRMAMAMGLGQDPRILLIIACLVAVGLCSIFFRNWMRRKPPVSPVENLYAAFCRNMAHSGVPRAPWEGPLAYTERAAEAFPDKKEAIEGVGRIVAHIRYGPSPDEVSAPQEMQSLLTLITASPAASSSREQKN